MCMGSRGGGVVPSPQPLPPAPAPPPPPPAPLPVPKPIEDDINPQVRRSKSRKAKDPSAKFGTGDLRIPLKPNINTGTAGQVGGLNK